MEKISSLQNPRVKEAVHLRDRNKRDKKNLFLIEGYRELLRATESDLTLEHLFFCKELFLGENENALMDQIIAKGAALIQCTESVFRKLSYRDRPDGLLGVAKQKHLTLKNLKTSPSPLIVVAEAIEKPGNLGTILRSSDAAGIDALIVCDRCTDIHNPNVVRASVGTLFTVPVIETTSSEALTWLRENGIKIAAATPQAKDLYTQTDMSQGIALAVGTEQHGLSKLWMDQADIQVRIPMHGKADSLNVATATTLLLYEALRQRT